MSDGETKSARRPSADLMRGTTENLYCVAQAPTCRPRVYSPSASRIVVLSGRSIGETHRNGDGRGLGDVP